MKKFVLLLVLLSFNVTFGQQLTLAKEYFAKGEFQKALSYYKKLHNKQPHNTQYMKKVIACYQELSQFTQAETFIKAQQKKFPRMHGLQVDLGYNYQRSGDQVKADKLYQEALSKIKSKSNSGASIARAFEQNGLYDLALKAYKQTMEANPKANYNMQVAILYGEKGDTENMFQSYLNMIEKDERYLNISLRRIGKYITDDSQNEYNQLLKKMVLKRSQSNPQDVWNKTLSWLFTQQKDYNKALIQEKALFARTQETIERIVQLGRLAFEEEDYTTAQKAFTFISENVQDQELLVTSKLYLLRIATETNENLEEVEQQFQDMFSHFGKNANTIPLQIAYADFLTFKKQAPQEAITLLKEALESTKDKYQKAQIKIQLADALVFDNDYNKALLYYSQVQTDLRNHPLAQTARFKVAQTSYFKGDFDWSQSQLKVLKGSTSQIISNDAIDLSTLISDNTANDSDSLQVALKTYAKADVLAFQNKNQEAITILDTVLKDYKGHAIEDEALFKQAELFTKTKQYSNAESNYLKILTINKEDILADDAVYLLAKLYENQLNNEQKASNYYEKIIFEYPSSIHLVNARKKFRKLRGDDIN